MEEKPAPDRCSNPSKLIRTLCLGLKGWVCLFIWGGSGRDPELWMINSILFLCIVRRCSRRTRILRCLFRRGQSGNIFIVCSKDMMLATDTLEAYRWCRYVMYPQFSIARDAFFLELVFLTGVGFNPGRPITEWHLFMSSVGSKLYSESKTISISSTTANGLAACYW